MSIQVVVGTQECRVTTTGKNGTETAVLIQNVKALSTEQSIRAFKAHTKGAESMRAASVSIINEIQKSGVIQTWFNGGKVVTDLMKKMREAEDRYFNELGLDDVAVAELRKPGAYADTRSHALKCWSFGVPLKAGVDAEGNEMLLTTSAMRSINAMHRKAPEEKGIDSLLDALEQYIADHPDEAETAEKRLSALLNNAKAKLDAALLRAIAQNDGMTVSEAREAQAAKLVA